ncbi:MAG: aspartate kinase [Acidobacteriota bacterium]
MRVLKFGGTSLADARSIDAAARRILDATAESRVLAVASALAGVTDELARAADDAAAGLDRIQPLRALLGVRHIEALHGLTLDAGERRGVARSIHTTLLDLVRDLGLALEAGRPVPRVRARILAAGERLSAPLLALAVRHHGRPARPVDAIHLLRTRANADPLDAHLEPEATRAATRGHLATLPVGTVGVVTGFLAALPDGGTALLGRGGSDTTATALAAAVDAERVEIWTDVDGVLTADPKTDPRAERLPELGYDEAEALARAGAKVLHPRSIAPAAAAGIPILVRNSFAPEHPGTRIGPKRLRRAV